MAKKIGRPLINKDQDAAMNVYTFRATAKEARVLRKIGGGSLTDGIRKLLLTFASLLDIMGTPKTTE